MTLFSVESRESEVAHPEDVQSIIDATQVIEVRLDEVHAGPLRLLDEAMNVQISVGEPQFGRADDQNRILIRFTHTIHVHPEENPQEVTALQLSHVVVIEVREAIATTWPAVAAWIETNVYFLAYPYVRQSVSALTASMGMPSLMLGYLNRDDSPFAKPEDD
jgi:preprotein translocase subunit SecB